MERKNTKKIGLSMMLVAVAAAAAGIILRRIMVAKEMPYGLLERGAVTPILMLALLGVTVVGLSVLTARLGREKTFDAVLDAENGWSKMAGAASLWIMAGSAMMLTDESVAGLAWITAILGVFSGAGMLLHAILRELGKKASFWTMLPACIWTILRLISHYQQWGSDPVLVNYCFDTLADITVMLVIYQIAVFMTDKGKRRISALWACLAVGFMALSAVDAVMKLNDEALSVLYLLPLLIALLLNLLNRLLMGKKLHLLGAAAAGVACAVLLYVLLDREDVNVFELLIRTALLTLCVNTMIGLCFSTTADPELPAEAPAAPEEEAEAVSEEDVPAETGEEAEATDEE